MKHVTIEPGCYVFAKRVQPLAIAALVAMSLLLAGCASDERVKVVSSSKEPGLQAVSDIAYGSGESSSASAENEPDSRLAAQISADVQPVAEASGMDVGVSIIDPSTGMRAGYRGDEQMVSASMIKLVIAAAFLEQVRDGTYSLDSYYTLQSSDIVGGTGTLGGLGAGAQVTYGDILNKMISVSDNTGANILISAVGMEAVNEEARKLELTHTQLNRYMMDSEAMAAGVENYTSADDVASLLAMVQNGTFVDAESSAFVLRALEEQQDAGGILGGLPAGVAFAHKTGSLGTVRHDGGIVEGEHPFVLVVLCGGQGFYEQGALDAMASIASVVYSDFSA